MSDPALQSLLALTPAPERIPLRAGPLTLCFEAGALRYLKLGEREVIRRLYGAVRDHNWGTVPGVVTDRRTEIAPDGFRLRFTSEHRQGGIHFTWQGDVVGAADGSIEFTFDGEAKTTFLRNRIGLCVLHPIRECAGARCRADYRHGGQRELTFPTIIAAEQPMTGFRDLAGLSHEVEPGTWAELQFFGEVFEVEDQRNWIDASFKTYGTPLQLPFPVEVKAGTRVRQQVRLAIRRLETKPVAEPAAREANSSRVVFESPAAALVRITGGPGRRPLPALGLGCASHPYLAYETEVKRLRKLKPAHLRIEARLWERAWWEAVRRADSDAADLGARVELVLHLNESPGTGLKDAARVLRTHAEALCRVLVLSRGRRSTTKEALAAARRYVGPAIPDVPLGAGTNGDLYQLNLERPPDDADFISWSMNPQFHASDCASIAETPEAAAQQVASVREYFPGVPLVVSPVTPKPRFNPVATGPEPPLPPGVLPPTVDYLVGLAKKTRKKQKAMILIGDLGDINAIGRRDGFEQAVKGQEAFIEVVARIPTEWNQEKALAGVQSALQANPDIGVIFTSSDFMFPSIKSVLSRLGKWKKHDEPGHVILGVFDGDATAYQMMVDGFVDATGVQDFLWESEMAVKTLRDIKAGQPAPARLDDKGFAITQANLKELEPRMWGAVIAKKKK